EYADRSRGRLPPFLRCRGDCRFGTARVSCRARASWERDIIGTAPKNTTGRLNLSSRPAACLVDDFEEPAGTSRNPAEPQGTLQNLVRDDVRVLLLAAEPLNLQARRHLGLRFLEDDLAIELGHLLVFLLRLARAQLLFARVLGNALLVEVRLPALGHGL